MEYDDTQLRQLILDSVTNVFDSGTAITTTKLVDELFVHIKRIVKDEQKEYTVAQLRELLS